MSRSALDTAGPAGAKRPARLDDRDRELVRRAARRIAVQSAAVLAVVVALAVTGLAVAFDRQQHAEISRLVNETAQDADDVGDPPPGVVLIETVATHVSLTPGAPQDLAVLARRTGVHGPVHLGGRVYVTQSSTHDGARYVAAYDLAGHQREESRLLWSSLVAGFAGVALAAAVGWVIGRRAVSPLAAALTRQRQFVADASHELRTPLTVLHTRAQLIRRRLPPDAPPEQVRDLDRLVADSSAVGEVVADLLLSAQLAAVNPRGDLIDVGELARSLVESMQPYAETSSTSLTAAGAGGPVWVHGVAASLRRALGALVDNAIEHAPGGHVRIEVSQDDRRVRVSVVDDGEGLDPRDRDLLLDRFSRGPKGEGSTRRFGLGLSLVDEVVRAHGGTLELAGRPGEGAAFTLQLPRPSRSPAGE